ncbi:MAG TPA: hypothetical protein PLL57_15880 [Flavobacteriales bacterium]|nr:hypothetical protein [Flavobacteriales bacterium]
MTRDREQDPRAWRTKLLRLKDALRRAFSTPELRVQVSDTVLLEGAITRVHWHTTGALFVRVKGYGRCRRQGTMDVVTSPPLLDLEITAQGLVGRTTIRMQPPVQPITLKVTPHMAAPFRTQVNGPVPSYDPATAIRSTDLGYARPLPAFRHDLPVIHGRMPAHIELEEPELNHHHVVQGLLNA